MSDGKSKRGGESTLTLESLTSDPGATILCLLVQQQLLTFGHVTLYCDEDGAINVHDPERIAVLGDDNGA